MEGFESGILEEGKLHLEMKRFIETFPVSGHPMALLSAAINTLSCYYPDLVRSGGNDSLKNFDEAVMIILSKVRTIMALFYRSRQEEKGVESDKGYGYTKDFLRMLFSDEGVDYEPNEAIVKALDLIFILHAGS